MQDDIIGFLAIDDDISSYIVPQPTALNFLLFVSVLTAVRQTGMIFAVFNFDLSLRATGSKKDP